MHTRSLLRGAAGLPALALLSLLGAPLLLRALPSSAQGQFGPHGAALEALQMERLERLFPGGIQLAAPAHMDPHAWAQSFSSGVVPSPAQVELGRRLFFETRLSKDATVSCATCHDVTRGFADRRPVSEGIAGQLGRRNAPTVMNAGLLEPLFWDGRAATAEHQAVMPLLNPIEMGMESEAAVVARLSSIPEYKLAFEGLFADGVTYANIGQVLGAFERGLVFLDAPFDHFLAGDPQAISADAQAGWKLFNGQARCAACHPITPVQPLGTNQKFHNIGVSARTLNFESLAKSALEKLAQDPTAAELDRLALGTDLSELGRFMITKQRVDLGAFKTPQLRNVGLTQPYMHAGSLITLWDVIDHYNKGGEDNPYLDGSIEALALSAAEVDQLVAFLFTLTDERFAEFNQSAYEQQKERAALKRPFRDEALAQRQRLGFEARALGGRQLPR